MPPEDRVQRHLQARNDDATSYEAASSRGIFDVPDAELGMLPADMTMPGASLP